MPWREQLIHCIDFEGSLGSGVVEYGVVSWQAGSIVGTHTRRCRPTGELRPEDVAIHGLSSSLVMEEAPLADDFAYFAELRATGPLAAHFANAESTLIKSVWPYPRQSPDFVRVGAMVLDWGPWIDTGRLYPQIYPNLGSVRLEDLIERCGLQARLDALAAKHCPLSRRHYHAALYDALAAMLLLDRLAQETSLGPRPLSWLLTMSTLDPVKREALNQSELF